MKRCRLPLYLICDSCPGQNKNVTMLRFAYILVHVLKLFDTIIILFPIRGHSFPPNDQNFSSITFRKKNLACKTPDEWIDWIRRAREIPSPFTLRRVTYDMFYNVHECISESFFLKTPRPKLNISKARMIEISSMQTDVKIWYLYTGNWHHVIAAL